MIQLKHIVTTAAAAGAIIAAPSLAQKFSGDMEQQQHCKNPEWGTYNVRVAVGDVPKNGQPRQTREIICFPKLER